MTTKKNSVGAPFFILVPGITEEVDSLGNAVRGKQKIEMQFLYGSDQVVVGLRQGNFTPATGQLEVIDNDFTTGDAVLYLGDFEIISSVHYAIGGSTTDTATNIAAVISNIEGFSASSLGSVVSIEGPVGFLGDITFKVLYSGSIENFTLTPDTKELTKGSPVWGPPRFS